MNFQVLKGRVKTRWIDYEKSWKLNADSLGTILKGKVKMIKETRASYPMDATYEEDKPFRVEQWDDNFSTEDVKFHDCTNINMPCPSDTALQSACYSESYGCTVGKGLVTNRLCGWIRVEELLTGKMGDTDTGRIVKVLIQMKRFAEKDTSRLLLLVLILNVLDKGFRNVVDAREQGQRCLQPCFARSDAQFTRDQTLHSACVAVVRSGNERAVRLCKLSRFLTHRYPGAIFDVDLICDIWLCWSFQTNFMYDRFL